MVGNITLQKKLAALIDEVDGKVGIYSYLLDRGLLFSVNADELFPLASTYKVPIAIKFLKEVEKESWDLEVRLEVQPEDIPESSAILDHRHFSYPGISLSLRNIFRLMLEYSDNTASDLILKLAGGPHQVTSFLRELGYVRTQINRTTAQIFLKTAQQESKGLLSTDQDSGSPEEMVKLLVQVLQQDLLSDTSRQFLIECMSRCKTGNARIRALLPNDTVVANKTGTATGFVNDLGIIDLPLANKLILAVYHKNTTVPLKTSEALIANIAKTIFDYVI